MSKTVLCQTIQLSLKTVPFQAIQFSISTLFSSGWPIDRTQSGTIPSGQSGSGTVGTERVLCIRQSSCITGTLPSDCLVSYPGHWLLLLGGGVLPLCRKAVSVFHSPWRLSNLVSRVSVNFMGILTFGPNIHTLLQLSSVTFTLSKTNQIVKQVVNQCYIAKRMTCGTIMNIYMDVCVWVCVCVHGWVAKERILSSVFLTSVRLTRGTPFSISAQRLHRELCPREPVRPEERKRTNDVG